MLEYAKLLIYISSDILTLLILFKGSFLLISFSCVIACFAIIVTFRKRIELNVLLPYTSFSVVFDSNV